MDRRTEVPFFDSQCIAVTGLFVISYHFANYATMSLHFAMSVILLTIAHSARAVQRERERERERVYLTKTVQFLVV